jgi:hypothetical protein
MADISFTLPSPYQSEQADIARRQKMAEIMQQQAFQPAETFSYGGIQARTSPLTGIAKALQGYMAGKTQRDLIGEQKALGEKAQTEAQNWYQNIDTVPSDLVDEGPLPARKRSEEERRAHLFKGLSNPATAGFAQTMLAQDMEEKDFQRALNAARGNQAPVAAAPAAERMNPMISGQPGSSVMAGAEGTTPPVAPPVAPQAAPQAMQQPGQQGLGLNPEVLAMSASKRGRELANFLQKNAPEFGTKGETFRKADGTLVERVYGKQGQVIERPLQATPYEATTTEIRNVNAALTGAGIDPNSPQGRGAFSALLNKMTSHQPATNVNVNTERSYFGNVAEGLAKSDASTIEAARSAPERVTSARRVLQTLQQNPITGTGADLRLQIDKALSTAGLIDPSRTQATENLMSSLAAGTLDSIKTSGLGAGQGFTDKDREFLERAKSGNIQINAQTLADLARLNERAGLASIEKGNQTIKRLKKAPGMSGLQSQLEEIAVPESGGAGGQLTRDQQALQWANTNPTDPRAAAIRKRLGQ